MAQFEASSKERLDVFLARQEPALTRSLAQRLIKSSKVKVNGNVTRKPALILKEGDQVSMVEENNTQPKETLEAIDLQLEVLYEDDACLVIYKPAGYAVHPAQAMRKDESTILNGIAFLFQERGIPFTEDATLVHRLDRETTGCLLVSKNHEAHLALQKQFADRTVKKIYLAIVAGVPSPKTAIIDAPIGRNLVNRTLMSIFKTSKSRDARTTYRTLESKDDVSFLECDLHTGRTHQVRVHLRSIGHPILGDATYATSQSEEVTEKYELKGLCLHAWKLRFVSPDSKEEVQVVADLPVSFLSVIEKCNFTRPPK